MRSTIFTFYRRYGVSARNVGFDSDVPTGITLFNGTTGRSIRSILRGLTRHRRVELLE